MRIHHRLLLLPLLLCPLIASAQAPQPTATFAITRPPDPITFTADSPAPARKDAVRTGQCFDTTATDNTEPKFKNVAWMTYDDHFFYAASHFEDPTPPLIRAPLSDRDNVPSSTD